MKSSLLRQFAASTGSGLWIGLVLGLALNGWAEVPQQLHFQGRITVAGAPFTGTGQFKFALITPVSGGQPAAAEAFLSLDGLGRIGFVNLTDGGAGYVSPPAVSLSDPTGSGAELHAVVTDGQVTAIEVAQPGTGYTVPQVVIAAPTVTGWANSPDITPADGVPDAAVSLEVVRGLYAVQLGDTTLPNMAVPVTAAALAGGDLRLRVWFDDGTHGFQQLSPDQPLASVGYALVAQTLAADASFAGTNWFEGPVGIGVTTPTTALEVHGAVKATRFEGDGSGLQNVLAVSTAEFTGVVAWGTTVPAELTGVVAITGGFNHSVALKQDGTIVAWGADNWGQATVPAGLSGVTAVAAGWQFTVALKSDGTIAAWGFNWDGEVDVPVGLVGVTAIAAGGGHTLALKADGTVVAWGNNFIGQTAVPEGLNDVTAVAAGGSHSVALKNDGTVVAWGDDRNGQATVPAGLSGVTAIAAGGRCTVALKQDGTVAVWGAAPAGPPGLTGVVAIAAGEEHIVALKNDGTVVAWGNNGNGQAAVPRGLSAVTAIDAGGHHSLALGNLKSSRVQLGEHINFSGDLVVHGSVTATAFNTTSDRQAKGGFIPVDPQAVLTKVAELPLSEWSFQSNPGIRHVGPMAQDFHAAFGLGGGDTTIATVDADGIALAAIQGLNLKLEAELSAKDQELYRLWKTLRQMQARLNQLEQTLRSTPDVP